MEDLYGLNQPDPLDSPFGLPEAQSRAPMPVQVPLRMPMPNPQYDPAMFMGRRPTLPNPAEMMLQRMGIPKPASNVLPFSPQPSANGEQPKPMTLEAITNLVRLKEGGNNYQALNTENKGNTASGAYQYTDGTWNNYGGYPKALLAPKEVQDRRFQEDLAKRYAKHSGDPFRILAEHYLPAYADNPETWQQSVKIGNKTVKPVAHYLRYVVAGTPLEGQLDAYLAKHQNK